MTKECGIFFELLGIFVEEYKKDAGIGCVGAAARQAQNRPGLLDRLRPSLQQLANGQSGGRLAIGARAGLKRKKSKKMKKPKKKSRKIKSMKRSGCKRSQMGGAREGGAGEIEDAAAAVAIVGATAAGQDMVYDMGPIGPWGFLMFFLAIYAIFKCERTKNQENAGRDPALPQNDRESLFLSNLILDRAAATAEFLADLPQNYGPSSYPTHD